MNYPTYTWGKWDDWPDWMLRWAVKTMERKLRQNALDIDKCRPVIIELKRKQDRGKEQLARHAHLLDRL